MNRMSTLPGTSDPAAAIHGLLMASSGPTPPSGVETLVSLRNALLYAHRARLLESTPASAPATPAANQPNESVA